MDKARGYNHDRLDRLVSRYRKLIRMLCWRNAGGDEYACDDPVQECYLSLWLHLVSLRMLYWDNGDSNKFYVQSIGGESLYVEGEEFPDGSLPIYTPNN